METFRIHIFHLLPGGEPWSSEQGSDCLASRGTQTSYLSFPTTCSNVVCPLPCHLPMQLHNCLSDFTPSLLPSLYIFVYNVLYFFFKLVLKYLLVSIFHKRTFQNLSIIEQPVRRKENHKNKYLSYIYVCVYICVRVCTRRNTGVPVSICHLNPSFVPSVALTAHFGKPWIRQKPPALPMMWQVQRSV